MLYTQQEASLSPAYRQALERLAAAAAARGPVAGGRYRELPVLPRPQGERRAAAMAAAEAAAQQQQQQQQRLARRQRQLSSSSHINAAWELARATRRALLAAQLVP